MLRKKLAMRPVISTASGGSTTQKKYRNAHCISLRIEHRFLRSHDHVNFHEHTLTRIRLATSARLCLYGIGLPHEYRPDATQRLADSSSLAHPLHRLEFNVARDQSRTA